MNERPEKTGQPPLPPRLPRSPRPLLPSARSPLPPAPATLLALAAAIALAGTLAGCASFQAWGQKSSGSPGQVGGAFNIPFGK